jgi:D-alanyl-D-alanine carboxypeptidase/D-alanyl-D-alanine-endopeptidase (penicillin-binding protein 4)
LLLSVVVWTSVWIATRVAVFRNATAVAVAPVVRSAASPNAPVPDVRPAVPPAPWSAHERAGAVAALDDAFAPALDGASGWSLAVVDATGATLYDRRADRAVTVASAQKLVVAATALAVLGESYRFHTVFAAEKPIGGDGILDGNLWLAGSGDPSLQTQDLRSGVAMLARAGLRRVSGGVAVDSSAMHGPGINPHWDPDDAGEDYAAPTSAVSVDGDTVATHQVYDGIDHLAWVPVRDVGMFAASIVQTLLARAHIATGARPAVAPAPLDSVVLWDHASQPLRALEKHMLFVSDNHYAEQLLRTLGGQGGGEGDDATGIAVERTFLSQRGIPVPGLVLHDGSGLSSDNRVAAITLARILSDAQSRGGPYSLYLLLPQGGRQGTLRYYDFTAALGRVRAKSGHITGVAALAGYANTMRHGRVAFAFAIDGSPGDPDAAIVRAVDRLVLQ